MDFAVGSKVVISVPFPSKGSGFAQVSQVFANRHQGVPVIFGVLWRFRSSAISTRIQDNSVIAFVSEKFDKEMT